MRILELGIEVPIALHPCHVMSNACLGLMCQVRSRQNSNSTLEKNIETDGAELAFTWLLLIESLPC